MSGEAQLQGLLEIIITSANQAIAQYKKGGNPVPTIHSKTYHPIDLEIDTVGLKKAVRSLEGACQQLCASLAPPQHTLFNNSFSYERACVGVVFRAKVADALERFPEGLHVDELAKLVNLQKGKLSRVLRLLANRGCFTEVAPNTFANNRISLGILSSSDSGVYSRLGTENEFQSTATLYEAMTGPDDTSSDDPDKSPLNSQIKDKGLKGNLFDWMQVDTERRKNFDRAMIGLGYITGALSVLHHYPWNEVKTVCDVGASIGTVSIPLSKMYPHLKIVDQDLPDVLAQAKDIWAKDAPEALQNNQVEFIPLDFFAESPVLGQDVYYLRNIIHDWSDSKATAIFKNIRNAMAPHSRLLIHDLLLRPASRDVNAKSFGLDIAPEPLLPDFGNGSSRIYHQDINMWMLLNAKERTLYDLIALGNSAGLHLEKVYDLAETAVVEFRVAA